MRKHIAIAALLILAAFALLLCFAALPTRPSGAEEGVACEEVESLWLGIAYDNNPYAKGFATDWGFSCCICADGKWILFDTGGDSQILLSNLEKLGVDPSQIDVVVLSHVHGDHIGGLQGLLARNNDVDVYLLPSFSQEFKQAISSAGARVHEVEGFTEISRGVYLTGPMGFGVEEQALVVCTHKGLVVVTGCAHPGVDNMVEKAVEKLGKKPYLVLGGFHLVGKPRLEIERVSQRLEELGVEYVAPLHCSGSLAREVFSERWGDRCLLVGVGWTASIS